MCGPKIPEPTTPTVAKALPAAEKTATSYERDNGNEDAVTGQAKKARRGLKDLRVDLTPPSTGYAGLQVA